MFVEDLDVYFRDFGEEAQINDPADMDFEPVTLTVIVDKPTEVVNESQVRTIANAFVVTCKTVDAAAAERNRTLTVRTVVYKITNIEMEGTGISYLHLKKS